MSRSIAFGYLPFGNSTRSAEQIMSRSIAIGYLQLQTANTTQTSSKPTTSSLLFLPPEIRILIYRYLLLRNSWFDGRYPNILRACRTIHQEACSVLYGETVFWFREEERSVLYEGPLFPCNKERVSRWRFPEHTCSIPGNVRILSDRNPMSGWMVARWNEDKKRIEVTGLSEPFWTSFRSTVANKVSSGSERDSGIHRYQSPVAQRTRVRPSKRETQKFQHAPSTNPQSE